MKTLEVPATTGKKDNNQNEEGKESVHKKKKGKDNKA
jgi:hypothetical protein